MSEVKISRIEIFILAFNLVVYRIDAFLYNFYDLNIVLTGSVILLNELGIIEISYEQFLVYLLIVPLLIHFLYAIVYIINDYVDYDKIIKFSRERFIYYMYRPLVFFNKSILISILLGFLYILCALAMVKVLKLPIELYATVILLLIVISILRSISSGFSRHILFGVLRIIKYSYIVITLQLLLLQGIHLPTFLILVAGYLIPYTVYHTVEYMVLSKDILLSDLIRLRDRVRAIVISVIMLTLFFLTFLISHSYGYTFNGIKYLLFIHMIITIPGVGLYFLSSTILKFAKKNKTNTFYSFLVKRLIDAIVAFFWCLFVVYIVM